MLIDWIDIAKAPPRVGMKVYTVKADSIRPVIRFGVVERSGNGTLQTFDQELNRVYREWTHWIPAQDLNLPDPQPTEH